MVTVAGVVAVGCGIHSGRCRAEPGRLLAVDDKDIAIAVAQSSPKVWRSNKSAKSACEFVAKKTRGPLPCPPPLRNYPAIAQHGLACIRTDVGFGAGKNPPRPSARASACNQSSNRSAGIHA